MSPEVIGVLGFVALLALLALRVPVAVSMLVVALAGNWLIVGPSAALARLGAEGFRQVASFSLSVVPLFILMGMVLSKTGVAHDAFKALDAFLWRLRGGLAMATLGASGLFASVSGSVVASASTMSLVAVPEMRRFRYDEGFAAACTAVGGTLGGLIPPSAVLVLYGVLTEEPIGRILIAGFVPGAMTLALLMLTAYLLVRRNPELAPAAPEHPPFGTLAAIKLMWAVPAIFLVSMGGLYFGLFTPTEAGGAGAALALLHGFATRRLSLRDLADALGQAVLTSAAIFLIIVAGKIFGFFLTLTRIPLELGGFLTGLDVAPWVVVGFIFVIYLVLGALMDELAILVIMTPITYPIIITLGFDGVWFGVLTMMMFLTGLLTPPVGLVAFIVSSVADVQLGRLFRALVPFWVTLIVAVVLAIAFPGIITWLPSLMS